MKIYLLESDMKFNTENYVNRRCCTDDRLKKLRSIGFKTNGYDNSMEKILEEKGFGLPGICEFGFTFTINRKYTRVCLNYSDALADEIILLNKLKLL